jgi:hypothetical protein
MRIYLTHNDTIVNMRNIMRSYSKLNSLEPAEHCSEHSEDGVDLTLIRWMLSLTPPNASPFCRIR